MFPYRLDKYVPHYNLKPTITNTSIPILQHFPLFFLIYFSTHSQIKHEIFPQRLSCITIKSYHQSLTFPVRSCIQIFLSVFFFPADLIEWEPPGQYNKVFSCVYIWFARQREMWKLHKEKQARRVCSVWSVSEPRKTMNMPTLQENPITFP